MPVKLHHLALIMLALGTPLRAASHLIEAEAFQFPDDWLAEGVDGVLNHKMLRSPGTGTEALTALTLPAAGHYACWVRARDYAALPGTRRYKLAVDGNLFERELGAHGVDGWKWEKAGALDLTAGDHVLGLRDTSKSYARADAIYLTTSNLDPNTLDDKTLAGCRMPPKTVAPQSQWLAPFAPAPAVNGALRGDVTTLENEFVRLHFFSAPGIDGKPQIVRESEFKIGGAWQKAPSGGDEKLFVLFAEHTAIRTARMTPSWETKPSNAPLIRFEVAGKRYEVHGGSSNPFYAAPAQPLVGRTLSPNTGGSVQIRYETPSGIVATGTWKLQPGAREVEFALDFVAPQDGCYSFGFSPFQSWTAEQTQFVLLPPVFQFQRLPASPVMIGSNSTPQPLVLTQVTHHGQALSLALLADPAKLPFEWANSDNSVYGFSLLNARGDVQPTIFSPVLGQTRSRLMRGQAAAVSWRVLAYPGDWRSALEYASNAVFRVTDYRQPYGASLTDAALNMVDLIKNDEASGWNAGRKGFWNIETVNIASQTSPLALLSAAILTRDEELYQSRALPSIEYTLSRPQAHFGFEVPHTNVSYINQEGTKIKVPSDFFGTAYWQGLHDLLGRNNPWLADLALLNGKVRYRASYSSLPHWSEMLGAYRLKPDAALLTSITAEADQFLNSEVHARKTKDLGLQPFYNVSYYPYWWDLLDLYEVTRDQKYLDAAEECAFFTIAGQWSHPRVPAGNITIHPGGEYEGEPHLWWKADQPFRLGFPRHAGATPEKQVPAWLVSQIGLGLEQPSTYFAAGAKGMRNIMMAAWAPNLLRLYRYTGRDIFQIYARNSIISRYANYPGYYISGYTDLQLAADYPAKGPDVTSIYYHHIPPHLAFTLDFLVTEAEQRSNGKINFPWVRQQGYVWFSNRVYGDAPGQVFGDATARLWLERKAVQVETPAVNYLLARADNRLWLILMNEADRETKAPIRLNAAALGLNGTAATLFQADGKNNPFELQNHLEVSVPAKGLVALALPTRTLPAAVIPPLTGGRVTHKLGGDWGDLEAFRIRSPFGKDSLYVVLTGRPKDGAATLLLEGNTPVTSKSYPYEFTVYPWPMAREMTFTLQLRDAAGKTAQTPPMVLPGS